MSLSIDQYREILSIGLGFQLAQLKGGLVFDDHDPAIEGDKLMRRQLERLLKQKKCDSLEKMLQGLIHRFQFKDEHNFASILLQKTGISLQPFPTEQISISTIRNLRVEISGKGEFGLTYVSIELPTGSGSIYCIRGRHSNLKATWLDTGTIEIRIPKNREEVERISKVKMYDETIHVIYKEQLS